MAPLPKCLLLPIDGTDDALRPVEFLTRLYPDRSQVSLILGYFAPPLPPAYQEKSTSPEFVRKKQELLRSREQTIHSALEQAKRVLAKAGFLSHTIEEHIQEKRGSKAKEACLLADRRKVDAVLVQKRVSSALEGFLRDDSTHSLLDHCMTIPIWFADGTVDTSHVAVCITNESASLRAVDHAAFMLSGTSARITVLHAARTISHPASSPASFIKSDLEKWLMTPEGRRMKPFFMESHGILNSEGIGDDRIDITVIASHGKVASEILSYCREQDVGIVVLGHSPPAGIKEFLRGSVTKKVLAELRNMTVWINQ
jgi:nucleotide-binding universal stress UspA family protein